MGWKREDKVLNFPQILHLGCKYVLINVIDEENKKKQYREIQEV
jgi:hypothetical protein